MEDGEGQPSSESEPEPGRQACDRGRIVVLRQNGADTTRIPFNYRKVAEGSEQDNFYVRPGDIIVVP